MSTNYRLSRIAEAGLDSCLMCEGNFPFVELCFRDQVKQEYEEDVTVLIVDREDPVEDDLMQRSDGTDVRYTGRTETSLVSGAIIYPEGTKGWYKNRDVDSVFKRLYQYLNMTKIDPDQLMPQRYLVVTTKIGASGVQQQDVYFGLDKMVAILAFERELSRHSYDTKVVTLQYAAPPDNEQPVEVIRAAVVFQSSFPTAYNLHRDKLEQPLQDAYQKLTEYTSALSQQQS